MPTTRLKMLVAYGVDNTASYTGRMFIDCWRKYSDFDVSYVSIIGEIDANVDLDDYDIVLNNYCVRFCFDGYVPGFWKDKLRNYKGLKAICVQDEYDYVDKTRSSMLEMNFDILMTSVPARSHVYVYGNELVSKMDLHVTMTGFAPEAEEALPLAPSLEDRPICVGYRGRDIGARYGKLAYYKAEIGALFAQACEAAGVSFDISIAENDRIYGDDWLKFLGSCRAMLGAPSGSNVFDFDGQIARQFEEETDRLQRKPNFEEFQPVTQKCEMEIDMGQISPRIFETAAMRTALVLVEGSYSDAIRPYVHYLPVKPDFSNMSEVLEALADIPSIEAMIDRAHDHLISSGQFSYLAHVTRWEKILRSKSANKVKEQVGLHQRSKVETSENRTETRDGVFENIATREPQSVADYSVRQILKLAPVFKDRFANEASFNHCLRQHSLWFKILGATLAVRLGVAGRKSYRQAQKLINTQLADTHVWACGRLAQIDASNASDDKQKLATSLIWLQCQGVAIASYHSQTTRLECLLKRDLATKVMLRLKGNMARLLLKRYR